MNGGARANGLDAAEAGAGEATASSGGHAIRCPFCQSDDIEPLAIFGSRLSTAHYYCRACHTPFEYIHRAPPPAERGS
ncbi:MAG TPA: hypothetical protein VF808_16865 [Ktedonobacterales bacterium]